MMDRLKWTKFRGERHPAHLRGVRKNEYSSGMCKRERNDIASTVIEACRHRGTNPFEYLWDFFTQMPLMSA